MRSPCSMDFLNPLTIKRTVSICRARHRLPKMFSSATPSMWLPHILCQSHNFWISPVGLSIRHSVKGPVVFSRTIALWCLLCSHTLHTSHDLGRTCSECGRGLHCSSATFLVEILDGFSSAVKSVMASALANLRFTEEEKLGERPPVNVIQSIDGNVFHPTLRSFHGFWSRR